MFSGPTATSEDSLPLPPPPAVSERRLLAIAEHPQKQLIDALLSKTGGLEDKYESRQPPPPFRVPADDTVLLTTPQEQRYADGPSSASHHAEGGLPFFVQRQLDLFSAPFVEIKQNYEDHVGIPATVAREPCGLTSQITPNDSPSTLVPNPSKTGLSDHVTARFDEAHEASRRAQFRSQLQHRANIFDHSDASLCDNSLSDPRIHPPLVPPVPAISLLVEAAQLRTTNLEMIEPIFVALAFYDPSSSRKLSEIWYFDFNDQFPSVKALLPQLGRAHCSPHGSRRALFTLQDASPDTCLVGTLSKVLNGLELDAVVEPYIKGVNNLDKYCEKNIPRIKRLGYFLRPFAHGFVNLFQQGLSLLNGPVSVDLFRSRSAMSEDGLMDMIRKHQNASSPSSSSSSSSSSPSPTPGASAAGVKEPGKKRLPIDLVINFKSLRPGELRTLPDRLSPHLRTSLLTSPSPQIIREIVSLRGVSTMRRPHAEPVHLLFFRPLSLNFSRHPNSSSRNIVLRISLVRSDLDLTPAPLPATVFGRSSSPDWVARQVIAVHYHESRPNWVNEEVKIALPYNLTPSDHLLIQFSHVSCTDPTEKKGLLSKKSSTQTTLSPLDLGNAVIDHAIEQELGYAWVPIYDQAEGIIRSELHTVPVSLNLVPGYLNPALAPGGAGADVLKYIDSGKPLFAFAIDTVSSLYPEDTRLHCFLSTFSPQTTEAILSRNLLALNDVDPNIVTEFFPIIFSLINELIAFCSPAVGVVALQVLSSLIDKINQVSLETTSAFTRNQMVERFTRTQVNTPGLHAALMNALLSVPDLANIGRALWYAFDLIIKSMHLSSSQPTSARAASVSAPPLPTREPTGLKISAKAAKFSFLQNLGTLTNKFLSIQRNAKLPQSLLIAMNANFSLFLKDLSRIADRGVVADNLITYLTGIDPDSSFPDRVRIKMDALRIFCNYEHWIPLALSYSPTTQPAITTDALPTFFQTHCTEHIFVGLFLLEVQIGLHSPDATVRDHVLLLVRSLLWKHAKDPRYDSPESQEVIADLYFPLLDIMISAHANMLSAPRPERRNWLISFLHVLRNCHRNSLLRPYWMFQTQKTVVGLLRIMEAAVQNFEDELMIREASFIVLDALTSFVFDYKQDRRLIAPESTFMKPAFDVFIAVMSRPQTVFILATCFRVLKWFVHAFSQVIFVQRDPYYCGQLCYFCLRYSNIPNGILQSEAAGLWWYLIETNFQTRKNFARVKLQSTIAISRLASGESDDYGQLITSLANVKKQANTVFAKQSAEINDLSQKLNDVIRDSVRIAEYKFDPEMTSELYYQVSVSYTHSPDLRISRLENLTDFHASRKYFEEAAQCRILMAGLVLDFLLQPQASQSLASSSSHRDSGARHPGLPADKSAFSNLSPGLMSEPRIPAMASSEADEEGLYTNQLFSETGFWNLLKSAASFFKWGGYYELGLEIFDHFVNRHQADRDYHGLSRCFREMQSFAAAIHGTERLFSRFYRIGFLGTGWGQYLDGKDFIYKEKNDVVFVQILKDRLLAQFSKKYPSSKIQL
ncbi:MAG: hypothetical protein Q8P67_16880, partial [archaeon]|nr:hypothetical protein [archaeon]